MSSSSSQQRNKEEEEEEEGMAPAADLTEPTAKVEEKKKTRRRRMTQEQIDNLIRYQTVHMDEEAFRRLGRETKELLTPEQLAYQGKLPVPKGQIDDYIADILGGINQSEARFMRERDHILNDYYTNGYAEEEIEEAAAASSPPAPVAVAVGNGNRNHAPGRRRFRPGVTKSKQAGKANKMV